MRINAAVRNLRICTVKAFKRISIYAEYFEN